MVDMLSISRRFRISLILGLATLAIAGSAWAYIPPATFILHSVAKKHLVFSTVRVRTHIYLTDENGNTVGSQLLETTVFYAKDNHYKSWVTDDTGKLFYMTERPSASNPTLSVVPEVLFGTSSPRMADALKAAGVEFPRLLATPQNPVVDDPNKLVLRRWNHTFAWVMGKSAQLWIEKDTFLPLRVIEPSAGDSDLYDIQMNGFQYFDDFPYPKSATIYEFGKKTPFMKADLVDAILDLRMTAADFPKEKVEGFTDAGSSLPTGLHDLIQKYYRLMR
jgi:hypothetical protein